MNEVSRDQFIPDFKKCGEVKKLLLAELPADFRFVIDDDTINRLASGIVKIITLREGAMGIGRLLTSLRKEIGGQHRDADDLQLKEEIVASVERVYGLYSQKLVADCSKTSLES